MSTETDLQNIIRKLKQKMSDAKRFQRTLAARIEEIDVKLERLKASQRKNKR